MRSFRPEDRPRTTGDGRFWQRRPSAAGLPGWQALDLEDASRLALRRIWGRNGSGQGPARWTPRFHQGNERLRA